MRDDLKKICVSRKIAISDAVRVLNDGHKRIVLIVDSEGKLEGVLADSDIRRAILNSVAFSEPVSRIMVEKPLVVKHGTPPTTILEVMRSSGINEIPVVDDARTVVGLATINEILDRPKPWEAVIMAGGLGKRLAPLTDDTPKPLLKVGDRPMLFIILDQLIQSGCSSIAVTVNYKGEQIVEAVNQEDRYRSLVRFVYETKPLGTAGSLSLLDRKPTSPFLVLNADVLTQTNFAAMLDFHRLENNLATVAIKEEQFTVPYGVIQTENTRIVGLEEKPTQHFFVNAGIYVLDPAVLGYLEADEYCDMTQLVSLLLMAKQRVGSFPVHEYWRDIGAHRDLQLAREEYPKV